MNTFEKFLPFILQTLIWIPTRFILWFFADFRVLGLENLERIDASHGVIFAANHASSLDPFLLPAGLPFFSRFMPIFYTSRERTFYRTQTWWENILYSTKWFRAWGAHQVYVGKNDFDIALQKHIEILKQGKSVLIFPEGGTTKDGSLRAFKTGVIHLTVRTGAPIIPIALKGTYGVSFKSFFRKKNKVELYIGSPIHSSDIVGSSRQISIKEYKNKIEILEKIISNMLLKV